MVNTTNKNKCVCNCSCGTKNFIVSPWYLEHGRRKSCGCILEEKKNTYEFVDDYVIGHTNKGDIFYFDQEDFEKLSKFTWRVSHNGYMQTVTPKSAEKRIVYEMHSFLLGARDGLKIDHINRNKKDNRKSNLRIVSNSMNGFNCNLASNNTSGKTGVSYNKKNSNYVAYIKVDYKQIYLGSFQSKEDAVKARKAAELKYFGELLNEGKV